MRDDIQQDIQESRTRIQPENKRFGHIHPAHIPALRRGLPPDGPRQGHAAIRRRVLLEHQIGKCGDAFSEIVLLSGVRQYPVELRHLPDTLEDAGPLSGLLAALEDSVAHPSPVRSSDTLAVMAVDLPEIEPATLQYLATAAIPDGTDVLIAEPYTHIGDKRPLQPLLGVYHRRITSQLRNYLRDGQRSVLGFLEETRTATFRVTETEIRNVNTKAEFDRLVNRQ